jgi:murein L,D-transpeptidase YafK
MYHAKTLSRIPILIAALLVPGIARADFVEDQKRFPRVKTAFETKESALREHFAARGLSYPPREIFLRVLKREKELELWSKDRRKGWSLVKTYPFCYASGRLGPKRKQGDLQVPEGFYHIDRFNPSSSYHLSLGVSYPNRSDRILGQRGNLGGDIFIHGDCVSIGCVAITDELIEEVYTLAVRARANGQGRIPVHIFPGRMDEAGMKKLEGRADAKLIEFWKNLAIGYRWFEEKKELPRVRVGEDGRYLF